MKNLKLHVIYLLNIYTMYIFIYIGISEESFYLKNRVSFVLVLRRP